jgi:hypothetical protein
VGIAAVAKRLAINDVVNGIIDGFKPPFPQCIWMVPFLKVCAGQSIDFIERIRLAQAIVTDAFKGDPNGHLLMFLVTEAVAGSSSLVDRAVRLWCKQLQSSHGTFGNLAFDYFDYKSHPFCRIGGEFLC